MKKVKGYFLQKMATKLRSQTEIPDYIPHFPLHTFHPISICNNSMMKNYSHLILKDILHPHVGQVI